MGIFYRNKHFVVVKNDYNCTIYESMAQSINKS